MRVNQFSGLVCIGLYTKKAYDKVKYMIMLIFYLYWEQSLAYDCNHYGMFGGLASVITCTNFRNNRSKGFRSAGACKSRFHRKAKSFLALC